MTPIMFKKTMKATRGGVIKNASKALNGSFNHEGRQLAINPIKIYHPVSVSLV